MQHVVCQWPVLIIIHLSPVFVSYKIIDNVFNCFWSLICYNTVTCRCDDTYSVKNSCIRWARGSILPTCIVSTAVAMSGCLKRVKLKVGICDISPLHSPVLQQFSTQELLESIYLQVLICFLTTMSLPWNFSDITDIRSRVSISRLSRRVQLSFLLVWLSDFPRSSVRAG